MTKLSSNRVGVHSWEVSGCVDVVPIHYCNTAQLLVFLFFLQYSSSNEEIFTQRLIKM